jgi:phosphoribosylanthranilate isomerase
MTMSVLVKICGLNDPWSVAAAVEAKADMIGLVFYPPSPRAVTLERAIELAGAVTDGPVRVALVVDPDDRLVSEITATGVIDMIQVHGHETARRVSEIQARSGLPVMKALRIGTAPDVAGAAHYDGVADRILFDAKAPQDLVGRLPGGNGLRFDWRLMEGLALKTPWMLSGGLDAENVAEAIRLTAATAVDTSSGVEDSPGVKNPAKIRAFIAAVREAGRQDVRSDVLSAG